MIGRRLLPAAAMLVVLAVTLVGIARLEVDTSTGSLLPAGDPAVAAWEETQASFGGDPVVVLLEGRGGGDLLEPDALGRLVALEAELAALPDAAVVYGPGTALNQIAIQLNELLVTVTARRDGLRAEAEAAARAAGASEEAARAAGDEAVAAYEARYGALVVAGLPLGLPSVRNPGFARAVFLDAEGRARPPLRWIVPDDASAAVYVRPREGLDQAGTERLVRAVRDRARAADIGTRLTVTGAPAVAASLAAEVRRELPLLALAALAAVVVAFLVSMRRRGRDALRALVLGMAATALTLAGFGLAGAPLSLGMLAFLPVMLGVGSDLPIQAAWGARSRTVLAAAAAGAAGFAALGASPLPFVRHLGFALAAGLLASALLALTARRLAPAAARRWTSWRSSVAQDTTQERPGPRSGRRAAVLVPAAGLAVVGWALLPSVPIEARPERLAAGLPALADAERAERVLGASGEVSVRVRADDVLRPDLLAWFTETDERLVVRFGDRLRPVVSPARLLGWLGPEATPAQVDAALEILPRYLTGASIRADRREAVASFGLRLGDLGAQAELVEGVRATLPPVPAGAVVDVTGLPVVASRGYELLSGGRLAASLAGPLAAGLVLLLLLPRLAPAAVAAPLLAVGWGVVGLRLLGIGLSPLTVGLGSLTVAVGAEFTVFARERMEAGVPRPWAGVVAAALTSAAGFAALALSRLVVLREFGLLLAGSVLLTLLAARVVTGPVRPKDGPPGPQLAAAPPTGDAGTVADPVVAGVDTAAVAP